MNSKIKLYSILNFFYTLSVLVRFNNLIILGFMQYIARIFLVGTKDNIISHFVEPEIFLLASCTILVAAGGYIINDYYDIKIDLINKPDKVILGKYISRRVGLIINLTINILAISMATFFLSLNVGLFISFCAFILWFYSNYLKRTAFLGNLCIAFLAFASLFMIYLFYQQNTKAFLFFAFFSFLSTLIREIIKDCEDIKGDQMHGSRTLPIIYGITKTKYLILFLFAILIFLFFNSILYKFDTFSIYGFTFILIPTLYIAFQVWKADRKIHFKKISFYMKWLMVLGIIGIMFW